MHGYLSADIICSEKRTVFRERTDNVQGQISVHIFEAKWMLLCLLSFKYFFTRSHFGRPFLKAFKRQRNSVSAQYVISPFKVFSFKPFNNLFGIKTKRANVNRKVLKLGNITWGISSDISQFWLHHVTCLDQSRAGKIFDGL